MQLKKITKAWEKNTKTDNEQEREKEEKARMNEYKTKANRRINNVRIA